MSFTIEKFDDEPIMIVTLSSDFRVAEHQALSDAQSIEIFEASDEPLYNILDLTNFRPTFNDILSASNTGARGEKPIWHHPKNRLLILISQNPMVKMATKGITSPAFGNLDAKIFDTLDEALTWIRAQEK